MMIRILEESDAEAWWNLRLEALEANPEAFGKAAEEHRATGVAQIAKQFRDMPEQSFNLGAFDNGKLIGMATFKREISLKERHKGGVFAFYVTADQRGKGVGRALLADLLGRARKDESLEQILLAVAETQPVARRLYGRFGFEVWGIEPAALKVDGKYVDEAHMILRLRR